MKKLFNSIILIAAVVVTGCTEHKDMEFAPVDNSGYTIIQANLETLLLESEERVWPEDAYIGVYGIEHGDNECYTIKDAGVGLKNAVFYGPFVSGAIAAYYPYDPSYIGNAEGMPVVLESEQEYGADAVAQFLAYTPRAYAYMKDNVLDFIYPNGLLHITVETVETLKIKEITISSAASRLSGLGILGNDGTLSMTETADSTVVLNCGEGVLSREGDAFADFYIVLVPGQYEDLSISLEIDGEPTFRKSLPPVSVERVNAGDFAITSVSIKAHGGPDSFIDTPVEFE